jgi:hypothetical protein
MPVWQLNLDHTRFGPCRFRDAGHLLSGNQDLLADSANCRYDATLLRGYREHQHTNAEFGRKDQSNPNGGGAKWHHPTRNGNGAMHRLPIAVAAVRASVPALSAIPFMISPSVMTLI